MTKFFIGVGFVVVVVSMIKCSGCYDSADDAWSACNSRYNGKCKYLGSSFKICK